MEFVLFCLEEIYNICHLIMSALCNTNMDHIMWRFQYYSDWPRRILVQSKEETVEGCLCPY
jgi:hypothetical protein